MFHQLLRQDGMCEGGPAMCPDAPDDDTPCEACGKELLACTMRTSRAGELVRRALDLEFSKSAGIMLDPDEVSCEDFTVLKIIASERASFDEEIREKARRKEQQQH